MTVPIYAAGVLGAFNEEDDLRVLTTFLQDLLGTLSLCQAPLSSLKAACSQLSLDAKFHELLLGVMWDGVVHTSASIRGTAARMFEMLIQSISESLVSNRIVPALVTLASDPEISVRIATVGVFGTILENVTERATLDKVYMQFQSFMDDPFYRDQHALHIELIRTFARVGPNAEPRFRDDSTNLSHRVWVSDPHSN
ncbi:hypothetical protein CAPTEDRAFT_220556 [Capitella teleta]|uniref:Condensin complex subunit 1 C-terminal domain-containing protein n=1 Tax=Capitella teleta TaxID=283909 RepID=R7T5X4_CAPTE|nr:hypothetical protein CAPTEDRAFT_220556 [Capitella teleta]|eukprot:ELT88849.1 hypothetical protein CAPTEDRAFT_220556 [Capitella teleta]